MTVIIYKYDGAQGKVVATATSPDAPKGSSTYVHSGSAGKVVEVKT